MAKHSVRTKLNCPVCKKAFYILPYLKKNGRVFCSILCRNRAINRLGKKHTEISCQAISNALRVFYRDRWIIKKCPTCNIEFKNYKKSSQIYCSNRCAYDSPEFSRKISQSLLGRKLSKTARLNVIRAIKIRWCNKDYKIKVSRAISLGRAGIKVSEDGRKSMSRAALINNLKGCDHWNWRGGISPIRERIRKIPKYKQWVREVFKRDNYACQICGVRGGDLEVDHYPKQFSQILDEKMINSIKDALKCADLWYLNNGRTLCSKCHIKTYKGVPKKIWQKL